MEKLILAQCSSCDQYLVFDSKENIYFCNKCKSKYLPIISRLGFKIQKIYSAESIEQMRIELGLPNNLSHETIQNKILHLKSEIRKIEQTRAENHKKIKKIDRNLKFDACKYSFIFYVVTMLSVILLSATNYFAALQFFPKILILAGINLFVFLLIISSFIFLQITSKKKLRILTEEKIRINALALSKYNRLGKLRDMSFLCSQQLNKDLN